MPGCLFLPNRRRGPAKPDGRRDRVQENLFVGALLRQRAGVGGEAVGRASGPPHELGLPPDVMA